MFEDKYRHMIEQAAPEDHLVKEILEEVKESNYWKKEKEKDARKIPQILLKTAITFCAVCLGGLFSLSVLAGSIPEIYELMYAVSPATAQFFMPVKKVCDNNGIRMEVVSAYVHENVAEIYITMEDLEGDRVDETTDLYDSYSIHRPFGGTGSCNKVDFDEETGKVTYLITLTEWGDQVIASDKLTFSVREFMSHQQYYEDVEVLADLTQAERDVSMEAVELNGFSAALGESEKWKGPGRAFRMLEPGQEQEIWIRQTGSTESILIEGMDICRISYQDGLLHVQTVIHDASGNTNHAFMYLKDSAGNRRESVYRESYVEEGKKGYDNYVEEVFEVTEEELAELTLTADMWITGMHVEGPWQVTFPLEARE